MIRTPSRLRALFALVAVCTSAALLAAGPAAAIPAGETVLMSRPS